MRDLMRKIAKSVSVGDDEKSLTLIYEMIDCECDDIKLNTFPYSMLAFHYENGYGVPANGEKAIELYKQILQMNPADDGAMFHIAECYYKGLGVDVDLEKALYWYVKSEDTGNYVIDDNPIIKHEISRYRNRIKIERSAEEKCFNKNTIYLKSFCIPKDEWTDYYFNVPIKRPKDLPEIYTHYHADERTFHNSFYPWKTFYGRGLERLFFGNITIFYGNNASGKSTLLNIIAQKLGLQRLSLFNTSYFFDDFCKLNGGYELNDDFNSPKAIQRGKVIVSDDVFNNILAIRQRNFEKDQQISELEQEFFHRKNLPKSMSQSKFIKNTLGRKEEEMSNGEAAFQYFLEQITERSLVLLDEPENSLSAEWQMILSRELYNMTTKGDCQFIIATHSPFILALPQALIYNLDDDPIGVAEWYQLENMQAYYKLFSTHRIQFEK